MAIKIKNISGSTLELHAHEFSIDEIFEIEEIAKVGWGNNIDFLSKLDIGAVVVLDSNDQVIPIKTAKALFSTHCCSYLLLDKNGGNEQEILGGSWVTIELDRSIFQNPEDQYNFDTQILKPLYSGLYKIDGRLGFTDLNITTATEVALFEKVGNDFQYKYLLSKLIFDPNEEQSQIFFSSMLSLQEDYEYCFKVKLIKSSAEATLSTDPKYTFIGVHFQDSLC